MSTSTVHPITARPEDTSEEAWRVQLGLWNRKTPEELLRMALEASAFTRAVALAGIAIRHPEYSEEERHHALALLLLGDGLFRKVYPGVDIAP